ncbi:PAS domain S-box protein [Rhodoferax aquaticus]|nr:PAS domain S-box protein [Rhodoferax aquaticus]
MVLNASSIHARAGAVVALAPWTPWLVWLVGCCLAAAAGYWKHHVNVSVAELHMQRNADAVAQTISARFAHPVFGLQGARGLYAASERVPRAAFLAYVESRNLAQEFPGVRGFGFAQRVLRPDLAAFVAAERADRAPQFAVRQLAGTSYDDLYIVKYLEPASGNPDDQGLDIGSDMRQRPALQRAVDTGMPTISGAIAPPQDQVKAGTALVIFVPVYAKGTRPDSIAQRRASLVGLLLGPVTVAELLDGMNLVNDGQMTLELFDASSPPEGSPGGPLLFGAGGPHAASAGEAPMQLRGVSPPQFSVTRQLPLLGRDFALQVKSTAAFEDELDKTTPWVLLLGGTLFSTLIAWLLHQQLVARRQAEHSANDHLDELELQKYALDQYAIVATTNVQGRITYVNDKLCEISGYSREELMGQDHIMLNSGHHPHGFFKAMYRTIAAGTTWRDEVCNRAKDGHLYWVDTTIVPVMGPDGKPQRYLAIRADITPRKHAETALKLQKAELEMQKYALDQHAIVATTNVQGRITYVNDKLCEISGYSREELMGQDHIMLNSGHHPHGFFKAMYRTVATGTTWRDEVCNRAKDGQLYWVDTTIVPVMDAEGKPERYLAIRADITLRKQVQLDLMEQQLSLEMRVKQKTAAAVLSENHLRLVMNNSLDAIIGMDAQGRITEWSSQAETAFAWTIADVRGKPWYQFVLPQRYHAAPQMGLDAYLASDHGPQPGKRLELVGVRRDGAEFPIELAISPIVTPQGTSYSAFISDITQHKKEQAELLAAKALAESASRAKSQFLANMSHEIRTPMNGVVGMVDILQKSSLLPQQRRMLGTIENSAMALLQILNDILDFSKIEAGMFTTERLPIRLCEVAEGVTDLLASGVGAQSDLVLSIDPALPQWCLGDPTRLRQVLLNLMGNAIKFSSKNGSQRAKVSLSLAPCVLESGADGVRIAVADNGIGMSPEVVAKLFQPFTQADESTSRKFGGTGLGLSITRALVELMGGSIRAKSTLGEGSEFVVDLPLQVCEPGLNEVVDRAPVERRMAQRKTPIAHDETRQTGLMILLAEDNEINREVMQEQLRLLGYPCESAEDGLVALGMWHAKPDRYGLLLSDCHMPNLDGFGLTAAIRAAEPADKRLPIIAVTANAMQGEAQRCIENGMDDYLSKPLRLEQLQEKLAQWMPLAAAGTTGHKAPLAADPAVAPAPEAALAPAAPLALAIWNPATLTALVGDNPGMHKRLLSKFLVNVEQQVVEIIKFAAAHDPHSLTAVAHTAKSAARSVGALALGELCQSLETAGRAGDTQRCSDLAMGLASAFVAASAEINGHLGL